MSHSPLPKCRPFANCFSLSLNPPLAEAFRIRFHTDNPHKLQDFSFPFPERKSSLPLGRSRKTTTYPGTQDTFRPTTGILLHKSCFHLHVKTPRHQRMSLNGLLYCSPDVFRSPKHQRHCLRRQSEANTAFLLPSSPSESFFCRSLRGYRTAQRAD